VRTVFFAWFAEVNDADQDTAWNDAALGRLEKISLQVVTHGDEAPSGRLDLEFTFFEIGDDRVDLQAALLGAGAQNFDCVRRSVHCGDLPGVFRKPDSIAACPASEVQSFAWRMGASMDEESPSRVARNESPRGGLDEERRWRGFQIFRGPFAEAVAFIPIVNFHGAYFSPGAAVH